MITGSSGMLGKALCQQLSDRYEIVGLDINKAEGRKHRIERFIECDIVDRERTVASIVSVNPDIVIHAAAYTDVEGCQRNPEKAHQVNAIGTETIALACQKSGAYICYISTDFVFDGKQKSAYIESDTANPVNIYGRSKLEGERYVQSILKEFIIVRSSWLFGKGGRNFVDTILNKAKGGQDIPVVNDQFGSPTYTGDLARAIGKLLSLTDRPGGIYHLTNSGSCSRYEFAVTIKEFFNLNVNIIPISTEQYSSPVKRPRMSILENRRYQKLTGDRLRHWKEALKEYLLEDGCEKIKR